MVQTNFILTDMMKTGNHSRIEQYLGLANIEGQNFELCDEYYVIGSYDLASYDRKFALLDHRMHNDRFWDSEAYFSDLTKRINDLKQLGFKFILTYPWESNENMRYYQNYDHYLKDVQFTTWSGQQNWFWFMMYERYLSHDMAFDHAQKKFDFFYLNKNPRPHRVALWEEFQERKLLKNSLVSFLPKNIRLPEHYELPWVDSKNYPQYGFDRDMFELPYEHSAVNIVSETHISDEIFITEKIWKPILAQQVFVVHGKTNYLEDLKALGFKTFGDVFDESYDKVKDEDMRIKKIVDLCETITDMDYTNLYEKTKAIREHNAKILFDKSFLQRSINKTVLGFLKFFDGS